jgi:hypothetical protein
MAKKNSTGLERQDAFIKSMEGQDFDFGLVMTQAFLKGIRDIGYKSTATALFESIDNSIQADASNIYMLFDFDKSKTGKTDPDRIAIVDDGYGMKPEMIRFAVLWGGSDRIGDRAGMGKYGYGLPSSCVSIGEKFTVISKREDMNNWYEVTIDVNKIGNRDPEYIDPKTQRIIAPPAKATEIPGFVQKYLNGKGIGLGHGTIVIIDKIDRLSFKQFAKLKDSLITQTGIYYRNYLRSTSILIDDAVVEPIDPLFTTEGFRYYDLDSDRAIALPPMEIPFKDLGVIKARFSYMPPSFLRKEEFKLKTGSNSKYMNARFFIRKANNGIIVTRAGRQIDVVTNFDWTTFVNYDRNIGIELDFPPTMDEFFSITTAKQQVVIQDSLWDALESHGVYSAIEEARNMFKKMQREFGARIDALQADQTGEEKSLVEQVMQEAAKDFEEDLESQPIHIKKDAEEELNKAIKQKAKEIGIEENIIKQALEAEAENRPYKVDFFDEEEGPFFRPKQIGGQVVIYINTAHRFYSDMYQNPKTTTYFKNALALLLFSLGISELRVSEQRKQWYQQERQYAWSRNLGSALEKLTEYSSDTDDQKEHTEEIEFSKAEKTN